MPEIIYHVSSFFVFATLVIILFTFSFLAITVVRRHIPLDFRYEENTAIVSCSALLGIIYAILIGFTILYQMNAFDRASKAENDEGKMLYSIYRKATFLPIADTKLVRGLVLQYANNTIDKEWPALAVGRQVDDQGKILIEKMEYITHSLPNAANNSTQQNALNAMIQDLNSLYEIRHNRIVKIHTTLNGHMWFVLLLATLITLGVNFLLGMEYRLHLFCMSLICLIMAAILYLIIGLDRPYQGDFAIRPDSIASIIGFAQAQGNGWQKVGK